MASIMAVFPDPTGPPIPILQVSFLNVICISVFLYFT
jgi:hypothetical protein